MTVGAETHKQSSDDKIIGNMTTKYDVRAWPQFRQCLTHTRWRPHLSHTAVYAETVEVFATVPIFSDRIVE